PVEIASFLQANKITTFQEIPNGDEVLELYANHPRHSINLLYFLKQAFDREITEILVDPEVGKCYNVFKDSTIGTSVFQIGDYVMSPTGFKVPREVDIYETNGTLTRSEQFENKQDYIHKRLLDLGFFIDLPIAYVNSNSHHGYSIGSSTNNSNHETEQTFLIERQCFKFTLNIDKLQLSQTFKYDIDNLPPKYDKNDENNVNMWKSFFEKNGTHVVKSAWVGGSVTIKVASSAGIQARIFNSQIQFKFYNEIEESKNFEQAINTARLEMRGGDPKYHVTTLQNLNSEKWFNSIKVKPVVLNTKYELIPINIVAGKHNSNIQEQMAVAIKDFVGGDLICIKSDAISEKQESHLIASRKDATNSSAPNLDKGTCLRSGTLISMANGTKVAVEKLNPGDMVVGKNGVPCHVLGRNDVLLGNRSLYGFCPDETAFFTSEHLFATQNDEWMCVDPDLSCLMNPLNSTKKIHRMQNQNNILRWNGKTTYLTTFKAFKSTEKFSPTMKVHCLLVTGGVYVANECVTHDSMPDLLAWPAVSICLASLTFSESVRQLQECFPTIDSLDDAECIRELSYQISTEWKKIIEIPNSCINFDDVEKAIKLSTEKFKHLIYGDQNFLQEILSKPVFTFLSQNLFILCGEALHESLNELFQNDDDEFYCKATLLFRIADFLITLHVKKFFK
ncbi:8750_t:CDS:2, partial [Cetraspora pellucida]